VAFYARGAMGHYIDSLVPRLSEYVDMITIVPDYYEGDLSESEVVELGKSY